jgi:hypothetical protein
MSRRDPWFRLSLSAWSLGVDAASVVALRTMKIAVGGRSAEVELRRMVNEKFEAGWALPGLAMTGIGLATPAAASKMLTHYRRKVRANRRRLARG